VNARLDLRLPGDRWTLSLVGKNLTDETVLVFGNDTPLAGSNFGAPGFWSLVEQPRTVALQATWTY
jgi:outer membrane receptor protein involved in Fe transport